MRLQDISDQQGRYSLSSSGLWYLVPVVTSNQTYTVTAVLPGDASKGDQVVIAADRPQDIDARGATGSRYEVYKSCSATVDGSSSSSVDLGKDEIQLPLQANGTYTAINSGQLISYYVLVDRHAATDSAPIVGLQADRDYGRDRSVACRFLVGCAEDAARAGATRRGAGCENGRTAWY